MPPAWLHALNSSPPCDSFALARRRCRELRTEYGDLPAYLHFERVVLEWQTEWDVCGELHAAAEAALRGEAGHDDARALLDAVAHAGPVAPRLYRGIWLPVPEWEAVAQAGVGSTLDLPLASFTSEYCWACEFAWLARNEAPGTEIVMSLEPGAKAVRIDLLAPDEIHWREREWITAGRFLVTASEYVSENDRVELTIVQESVFNAS